MNRLYWTFSVFDLLINISAGLAGVAQPGQSVRLIIERSRAQIPPPALFQKCDNLRIICDIYQKCS